jgi:ketosteroid isomerase-like protein
MNTEDWAALGDLLAPDMELRRGYGLGSIEGGDEVLGFASTPDAFLRQTLEPVGNIEERGDRLLAQVIARAVGSGSDVEVEQRVWHVATVSAGRIARLEVYFDEDEARQAFGR